MKKFKFTLQNVLRLKENMEENEKMVLYGLKAQLNALYDQLEVLETMYRRLSDERKEKSLQGITIAKLTELTHYIKEIDRQKAAKQSEINKMLVSIEKQTEVLKQIRTEVKMLEKLKEKQLAIHNKKAEKENEILIEDFIAGRV